MNEIWKEIEGYPNYIISNMGRIKSLNYRRTGKEKIIKGSKNNSGYLSVTLSKKGKMNPYLIHRLVAQAFLDNPDNLSQVNHKNELKDDNRVENLEWCSPQHNINYGTHNEKVAKTNSIPIIQFSKEGNFIQKWESATQVERELGFYNGHISKCCKGKLKSAYGYKWGYAEEYERIPFKVFDDELEEEDDWTKFN